MCVCVGCVIIVLCVCIVEVMECDVMVSDGYGGIYVMICVCVGC